MAQQIKPRQKPSVLITTYPATNKAIDMQQQATSSELVTELFNKIKRSRAKLKQRLDLNQIKGPTGTIRGHKDVVRKSLENIQYVPRWARMNSSAANNDLFVQSFSSMLLSGQSSLGQSSLLAHSLDETCRADYLGRLIDDELGQCVAYTTTLGIIRRTFEDSKHLRSILDLNLIKYEERDIYLNQEYKLQLRMRCNTIIVPALFVDGHFLGGIKELELMNENGELLAKLGKLKMLEAPKTTCSCCGNAKFIACQSCNGSRKSTIHHFKYNSVALRCIKCDKNDGLIQCPACSTKSILSSEYDSNNNNIYSDNNNNNNNNAYNHYQDFNENTNF